MAKRNQPKRNKPESDSGDLSVQQGQAGSAGADSGQAVSVSHLEYRELTSGPLPPPSMLAQYDEIVSGAAERILSLAEQQTHHRIELEDKVVQADIDRSKQGLWLGFVIALVTVIGGVVVAMSGYPTTGGIIATTSVIGLVSVFVIGTTSRRKERQEKAQTMAKLRQPRESG